MKTRLMAILMILSLLCCAAALGEESGLLATRENVEAAVRELLSEPWLPQDAAFNCTPQDGVWRVGLTRGNEALAEMYVDGDWEAFIAGYLTAGYVMPGLSELMKGREQASPDELEEGGVYRDEAEAVFTRLRGSTLESMETVRCEFRLSDQEWVFGLERPGEELCAVLILRQPEDENGPLRMMAYVDMCHNWNIRYPGCISIDEAADAAVKACGMAYDQDAAQYLQMENAVMIVGDAAFYSMAYDETGTAPEVPFWMVVLLDMRAQPDSLTYDESVGIYRYHILVNPFDGEIMEIWTEDFGWG